MMPERVMMINVEIGKKYLTRDGNKTSIIEQTTFGKCFKVNGDPYTVYFVQDDGCLQPIEVTAVYLSISDNRYLIAVLHSNKSVSFFHPKFLTKELEYEQ